MDTPRVLHGNEAPSAWVQRWSHLVPPHATVLDLACGHGRHMRHFAQRGHSVVGVDKNPEAMAAVAEWGEIICADIENGPWPLTARTFEEQVENESAIRETPLRTIEFSLSRRATCRWEGT
jgi:SAM-dependent methyltransferase